MKSRFRSHVTETYEHAAKSCLTCSTPGACCLDAHFVNVHISRLEAAAIAEKLAKMGPTTRTVVSERVDAAIEKYELSDDGDTFARTFACPLFEPGTGCLVHGDAKPLACITHACYETPADLPPGELQSAEEKRVDELNDRVYGREHRWLPLPVALQRVQITPKN